MKHIEILPSKSDAHRQILALALAGQEVSPGRYAISRDVDATIACTKALLTAQRQKGAASLPCGESGTTLRLLLPVCGALGISGRFFPEGRLLQRPLTALTEQLEQHGCTVCADDTITIRGQLTGGDFFLPGDVSSQFVSGLLFALPLLPQGGRITVEGALQSEAYVTMTLQTLHRFGIAVRVHENSTQRTYEIDGGQRYRPPRNTAPEGDWSNAAFWIVAGLLGDEPLTIHGLPAVSAQGDRRMAEIARRFGATLSLHPDPERSDCLLLCTTPSRGKLTATVIDAGQIPDLIPPIALLASAARGTTIVRNAARLRLKESDRLAGIADVLNALGGSAAVQEDRLHIRGQERLRGGGADGRNDHRLIMMASIASLLTRDPVTLRGTGSVAKSYPHFFEELHRLDLHRNLITDLGDL